MFLPQKTVDHQSQNIWVTMMTHMKNTMVFLFPPEYTEKKFVYTLHYFKMTIMVLEQISWNQRCLALLLIFLSFINVAISDDQVVVEHSYWERLDNSKSKVVTGLLLIILTPYFLWLSEKQMVKHEILISRCQLAVREVMNPNIVLDMFNSRPVLVKGKTASEAFCNRLRDREIGFTPMVPVVRLKRVVEMFQWQESKKEEDKRTVYTYHKGWTAHDSDSSLFQDPSHRNPHRQPNTYSTEVNADVVKIGGYTLTERQVDMMNKWQSCHLHIIPSAALSGFGHLNPHLENPQNIAYSLDGKDSCSDCVDEEGYKYLLFNGSLDSPVVGTVRMRYEIILEGGEVTTVAVQDGDTFRPFTEKDAAELTVMNCCQSGTGLSESSGEIEGCACCVCCGIIGSCLGMVASSIVGQDIMLLVERLVDIKTIFGDERKHLKMRMLLLRFVCYLLLSLGFYMTVDPISTFLSFVPFLGKMISSLLWAAALIVGFALGMFVSSVAWVMHRPHFLAMLLMTVGSMIWILGGSERAVTVGQTTCVLSLVPFSLAMVHLVENMMIAQHQRQLDVYERNGCTLADRCVNEESPLMRKV